MYLVHEIRFSFCTRSHSRRRVCRKGVPPLCNFYTKFNPFLYWPISSGGWETGQTNHLSRTRVETYPASVPEMTLLCAVIRSQYSTPVSVRFRFQQPSLSASLRSGVIGPKNTASYQRGSLRPFDGLNSAILGSVFSQLTSAV